MITQEPRIDLKDIFAGMFVFLGLLMFLIILHLTAIETTGAVQEVMNTTFIVFLGIFITLLIISGAYIIIHLLKWLVWTTSTPAWQKTRIRRERDFGRQNSR